MNESYYKDKSVHYGIGHTRLRRILELAGDVQGKRILDVGCAGGYVGAELKKRGAYVVGTDISEAAVDSARQKLDEAYLIPEGEVLLENAKHDFDLIIMTEVLEHVFDPVSMLKKAAHVLKPDGEIIISTPNFLTWTNRTRFLFGKFAYQEQGMFDFGHIRWFTYGYLKKVLRDAGLMIKKERHIIFPGKLSRVLRRWPSFFAWQFIVKAQKIWM